MYAPRKNLAELPGVEAHDLFRCSLHRRFDDNGRRSVSTASGATVDETAQILIQPGHVEGAMFHTYVDVVGPCSRIFYALRVGEHMPCVSSHIVDRLVLGKQFDGSIDPV